MNRQKLYEIFETLFTEKFYEEHFEVWEKFLHGLGIDTHNWDRDTPHVMFSDMIEIISENPNVIAISDPAAEHSGYSECFACILIPRELAEKVLVLGGLPSLSSI